MPINLDMRTLVVGLCMTFFTLSLCMVYYSKTRKIYAGFGAWTIAITLHALGFFFLGLRDILPDLITIVLANLFLFHAVFFTYHGFKSFAEEEVKTHFHFVFILFCSLVLFPFFTYALPNVSIRFILISFVNAFYFFLSTLVFVKAARHARIKLNIMVFTALVLLTTVYLSRGVFYLLPGNTVNNYMSAGNFYEIILILATMLSISLVGGLIQLNSQKMEMELSHEHERVKESEKKFRAIFEQAAVGVALTSTKSGQLLQVNQKYCDITGYTEKDLKTIKFQKITHPDDLQANLSKMRELKEGKTSDFSIEKRYLNSEGSIVWVKLTVSPMWKPGERPTTHIAVIEDITEHKKLEAEVRTLGGLLPICSSCKKIRDDQGYWNQLESYIQSHSDVTFSHGMCTECSDELYGSEDWYIKMKKKKGYSSD